MLNSGSEFDSENSLIIKWYYIDKNWRLLEMNDVGRLSLHAHKNDVFEVRICRERKRRSLPRT
jgi:hypothetical protein